MRVEWGGKGAHCPNEEKGKKMNQGKGRGEWGVTNRRRESCSRRGRKQDVWLCVRWGRGGVGVVGDSGCKGGGGRRVAKESDDRKLFASGEKALLQARGREKQKGAKEDGEFGEGGGGSV